MYNEIEEMAKKSTRLTLNNFLDYLEKQLKDKKENICINTLEHEFYDGASCLLQQIKDFIKNNNLENK